MVVTRRMMVAVCCLMGATGSTNVLAGHPCWPIPPDAWRRDHVVNVPAFFGTPVHREVDGRACIETTGRHNSRRLQFAIDDKFLFDVDETVEIEVEYDASVSRVLMLGYDSHKDDPKYHGAFQQANRAQGAKGKRWVRHTFVLKRARLANRQNLDTDFNLTSPSKRIRIADIRIRRPEKPAATDARGTLRLRIIDDKTGKPTSARVGLYDEKGLFQMPNDQAVPLNVFWKTTRMYRCMHDFSWPVKNKYAFYTDGDYECSLPPGKFRLVVRKGILRYIEDEWIAIEAGKTLDKEVTLRTWRDLAAEGWYSGDVHVHIRREEADNASILTHMAAEDVNVANMSQMGNSAALYFPQYAFGQEGKYGKDAYVLVGSHEDPRTGHRGHTLMLNMKSVIRDEKDYFLYHKVFEEAKRQGALNGYAHSGVAFNAQRGMAVDVPFNIIDFVEILQRNNCHTKVYYKFLNLGYELVPAAGSDFPFNAEPGVVFSFAHLDGPFSASAWFDAFGEGHTFATNGPIVKFTVNGQPMGSHINADKGDLLQVKASAAINPDIDKLARMELIVHGETIASAEATEGTEDLELRHTLEADNSMWLAVKVTGHNRAVAHTAPIYVAVDGKRFWKPSEVPELIAEQRQQLRDLLDVEMKPAGEPKAANHEKADWPRQRALLEPRVQEAHGLYKALLESLESREAVSSE